jgi:protein disulfide-isomerase
MRFSLYSLLSLATVASTLAADTSSAQDSDKDDGWGDKAVETTFNGEKVPPMIELTPDTFPSETKKGNW